jgi:hypothetical protein
MGWGGYPVDPLQLQVAFVSRSSFFFSLGGGGKGDGIRLLGILAEFGHESIDFWSW